MPVADCRCRCATAIDRQAVPSFASVLNSPRHMYITDARHFLDDKGAIAPSLGPARAMAEFHGGVIAYSTDFDDVGVLLPRCFKCKTGTVRSELAQDDAINWHCPGCHAEGRISNWQGTLWDLSDRPAPAG